MLKLLVWIILGVVGLLVLAMCVGSGSEDHGSSRSGSDRVQQAEAIACDAARRAGRGCDVCIHVAFGTFITHDNRSLSRLLSEAEKDHIRRNAVRGVYCE